MSVGPGTVLGGRYRLTERIAGGGMGDVWRGDDEVLGRTVAVKILLPALLDEHGFAERFRGEARTMATISHPGVVNVYDYGSDSSVAYLVMEHVQGDPLSRILSQVGRLTPRRTMALVAQAAEALQAAHDKGIVHRDVKPGNLLVRPNGTLVLVDFGIARSPSLGQLTAAGSVLGTASYISPEQASGEVATPLSDVYALGVVAYQCLSGRRPFEGGNPVEIAMRHVREQPPRLPDDVPPAVRSIVERAMDKAPSRRWPNATAFASVSRQAARALAGAGRSGAAAQPGSPIAPDSAGQQRPAGPPPGAPRPPSGGSPAGPAPRPPAGPAPRPPAGPAPRPPAGPAPRPPAGPAARPGAHPPQNQPVPTRVMAAPPPPPGRPAAPASGNAAYPRGSASVPGAARPASPAPAPGHGPWGATAQPPAPPRPEPERDRRVLTIAVLLLVLMAILLCLGGKRLLARAAPPVGGAGAAVVAQACQARPGGGAGVGAARESLGAGGCVTGRTEP